MTPTPDDNRDILVRLAESAGDIYLPPEVTEEIEDAMAEIIRLRALTDGEPEQAAFSKCAGCNRPYSDPGFMDLIAPDDIWAQISPTGDEGGLLCPGCTISAMIDAGQTGKVVFRSGPLNGQSLIIHTTGEDDG